MISLDINGKRYACGGQPGCAASLVIREHLKLTGTKYGCGIGCAAPAPVHMTKAERSCQLLLRRGKRQEGDGHEGIPEDHPLKKAWIDQQVPHAVIASGQIMQAAATAVRRRASD